MRGNRLSWQSLLSRCGGCRKRGILVRIEATHSRPGRWECLEGRGRRLPARVPSLLPSLRGRPSGARGQRTLARIGRCRRGFLDLLPLAASTRWDYLCVWVISSILLRAPYPVRPDLQQEEAKIRSPRPNNPHAGRHRTFLKDGRLTGLGTASFEAELEAGSLAFCTDSLDQPPTAACREQPAPRPPPGSLSL